MRRAAARATARAAMIRAGGHHPPAKVAIGLDVGITAAKVVAFGLRLLVEEHCHACWTNDERPLRPLVDLGRRPVARRGQALHESGQAAQLHRRSGSPVHPVSPLTKLT